MSLADWLDALARRPRILGRPSSKKRPARRSRALSGVESLEERRLLTTTMYLDFGLSLPNGGLKNVEVSDLRDINGSETGPDLVGDGPAGNELEETDKLTLKRLDYNYDGGPFNTKDDLTKLQKKVLPIVKRALAPFDIDVQIASATNFDDVRKTLRKNNKATNGKNDAYIFVTTATASRFTDHNGSVGENAKLLGTAAGKDFDARLNGTDEVAIVFADNVIDDLTGDEGSRDRNQEAALRLAYVAVHEAAHTFGLHHTEDDGDEGQLAGGNQIQYHSNYRETYNFFTRFDLEHEAGTTTINTYNQLAKIDTDIGKVDVKRNGKADLAYVTGTGAHDRIRLSKDPVKPNIIDVSVEAYSDAVGGTVIRTFNYELNMTTEGEFGIRIDAGPGNDHVEIDEAITVKVTVYGGYGNDTIYGGGGNDKLYGQEDHDTIFGRLGNDRVYGGSGNDTLDGGDGNDYLEGYLGADTLNGRAGDDFLFGDQNADTLNGGSGKDYLSGGSGDDTLKGGSDVDHLSGEEGSDALDGEGAADHIWNYDGDNVVHDPLDVHHNAPAPLPDIPDALAFTSPQQSPSYFTGNQYSFFVQTAQGPLSAQQVDAIRSGLTQLAGWAQTAGGALPIGNESAGAALADMLSRGLVDKVTQYFDANPTPTIEGLVTVLQGLNGVLVGEDLLLNIDPTSVLAIADGMSTQFELRFKATRNGKLSLSNLGAAAKGIEGADDTESEVPLTTNVDFQFVFGVDFGPGGQDIFFVQLPAGGITVQSNIAASDVAIPLHVGLLDAYSEGGYVLLDADTTLAVGNADVDTDGRLRIAELTAGQTTTNPTGVLFVQLPFEALAGTYEDAGVLQIVNNDLSAGTTSEVTLNGSEEIEKFATISPVVIVQWLSELATWLESIDDAETLAAEIPFTSGLTVGEIVDFAHTFRTQVLDLLIDEQGAPTFDTFQELTDVLLLALDSGPLVVGLDYDPDAQELVYRLDVSYQATHAVPLALDMALGGIVDVQLGSPQSPNPQLELLANVSASLVFGINLGPSVSTFEFNANTPLSSLNDGSGVTFNTTAGDGSDLQITLTDGSTFLVDFSGEVTVGEIAAKIESASTGRVQVIIDESGRRLRLVQDGSVALGGKFKVEAVNGSVAGAGLGILDESADGTIEGAGLDGSSLLDRFFIREISLSAEVSASIDDLDASARLGIFNVAMVDGTGSLNVGVSLTASEITAGFENATFTAEIHGSANLDLPLSVTANVGGVTLTNTRVMVTWSDITDPGTFSAQIAGDTNLTGALETVAMQYIVEGLKQVVGFLQDIEQTSVFQSEIPVLNRSLADLLDTSEKLDALALELDQNPPATINDALDRINALLGSAAVTFSNGVLQFDLDYGFAVSQQLNLAFDLDDSLGGVLEQFVDLSADAPILLAAAGSVSVGLGIDLNGGSPQFFVTNTSGLTLEALVESTGINLDASIGPLGVFVRNGAVRLDNGTPGQAASWSVSLAGGPSQIGLGDFLDFESLVSMQAIGRVDAVLPVSFPRPDVSQGEIMLQVGNLDDIADTTTLSMPDFAAAIASLDISDLLGTTIDGWDGIIRLIQDALDGEVLGVKLPLVGDKLAEVGGFLDTLRADVVDRLESVQHLSVQTVQQALFDVLAPTGWLVDRAGDGDTIVTVDDIVVQTVFDAYGLPMEFDFEFDLAGTYDVGTSIDFDLGLDGLGLDIEGAVDLAVAFQMDVGFGLSRNEGFYFHSAAAPELSVSLVATLPGAAATASLAFLQLSATDSAIDPTHFTATLTVDLLDPNDDGRLTLAEMTGATSLSDVVAARLSGEAEVNLHLSAGTAHPQLPSIEADFHLLWQFDTSDPSLAGEIQALQFSDVKINLGQFVNNVVEPVLSKVEMALGPVMPVIDALTTRVPVLSDLAGRDITLLDLATQFGDVSPTTAAFIDAVMSLATDLPDYSGFIHLGDLVLDGETARHAANLGKLQPAMPATGPSPAEQAQIEDLEDRSGFSIPILHDPAKAFGLLLGRDITLITYEMPRLEFGFDYRKFFPVIGPLGVTLAGQIGGKADFAFGYDTRGLRQFVDGGFDDPALIANGFFVSDRVNVDGTGEDIREVEFFGGLAAYAAVSIAVAEMGVGGGLKATIGLDLNDPDNDGKVYWQEIVGQLDQGSLVNVSGELMAFLKAYLTVDLGLFSKTWEKNFAETELASFSYNPAPDATPILGEMNGGELRLNIGSRAGNRLIGDTADGDEHFEVEPGSVAGQVVVKFFSADGVATQTFDNVTSIVGDGGQGNDTIVIHSGVTVGVELRGGAGNDSLVAGGGAATLYGDDGNDQLTAGSVATTIDGGAGNDTLTGGSHADILSGGEGDDILLGGGGGDTLRGGDGNDHLDGQAGEDALDGGQGNDTLLGGDDADQLSGGRGQDTLDGQSGNDTLAGGDDNDTLFGGIGNDLLQGDDGDDTLRGGNDDDTLEGGSGDDQLFGEAGIDALFASIGADLLNGGDGDDTLHGGTGADLLLGGTGVDHLFGDEGVDALFGHDGDDWLYGGVESDELSGGAGADKLFGEAGHDLLFGYGWLPDGLGGKIGNNQIADAGDWIEGGDGNDQLFGGQGGDVLEGGLGSDLIDGQSGEDRIRFAVTMVDASATDDLSGGPHRDLIEVFGTDEADDLQVEQIGPGQFRVERRDPTSGQLTATFVFTLPENPLDRDIELLRVSGGKGNDTIRAIGTFNVNQVQLYGGDGDDLLEGSAGDDMFFGGIGNDTLLGYGGRDELHGGDGNDTLDGGMGSDALYGEAGDDTVNGGEGSDVSYGGAGNDTLLAGPGILGDLMFGDDEAGASGNDTLIGGEGVDVMFGGLGDDRLEGHGSSDLLHGEGGIDTLLGGAGRDFLSGGADGDFLYAMSDLPLAEPAPTGNWIEIYNGLLSRELAILNELDAVQDEIDLLEARIAELVAANSADPAIAELEADRASRQARRDNLSNELAIINLAQNDVLPYQSVQVDILVGDSGDDWLQGSNYNDRLIGGSGNDTILHTAGADIVFGGTDELLGDTTDGVTETDEYRVRGTEAADTIVIGLDAGDGTGTPIVFITVNGLATQVSHLGIEVAGVEALGGDDTVTVQFGANAAMKVHADGGDGNDVLDASTFQDDAVLIGGAGNDTLLGGLGNDTLHGDAGDDVLAGGDGLDTLNGGADNDTLTGGSGSDTIYGMDGLDLVVENVAGTVFLNHVIYYLYPFGVVIYDTLGIQIGTEWIWDFMYGIEAAHLTGSDGADTIDATSFQGNATLLGGAGNDTLIGGWGHDTIDGGIGDDKVTGRYGDDTLIGGDGLWDQLIEEGNVNMVLAATTLTGLGNDTHVGFELAKLTGGEWNNTLDARNATIPVTLYGGLGDDTLHGSSFNDTLMGGYGNDTLFGWNGDDSMNAEDGNDWLMGGEGNDIMMGGAGMDTLYGTGGDDYLIGGQGNDFIMGEAGNDTLVGDDIVWWGTPTAGGDDQLHGGSGNDYLYGQIGNDSLYGGDDNDQLYGGDGNDYLDGQLGDDQLYGEAGQDYIYETAGYNTMYGGLHNDWIYGGPLADTIYGDDGDDYIEGRSGSDYINGGYGNDTIYGGNDSDSIYGGAGYDYLDGGYGNDYLSGQDGNDTLRGGWGHDSLHGGYGTDWLYGDGDNDYLDGGHDYTRDYLYGGTGADQFVDYYTVIEFDYYVGGIRYRYVYQETIGDLNSSQGDWKRNIRYY